MKWFLYIICFINVSASCQPTDIKRGISILFVGNSLTYYNNLPKLVEEHARKNGAKIRTEMLAFANYALEDHWNDGNLQKLIESNQYDYVVVQQGPSSRQDGREMLLNYGAKIKALCKQYNSQLVFFMVWPSMANLDTFEGVIRNYTEVATETQSLICPVGEVWKEYFYRTNDFSYYGPDGFHQSLEGSESAAQIIAEVLCNCE